jgi:hypothetical protein
MLIKDLNIGIFDLHIGAFKLFVKLTQKTGRELNIVALSVRRRKRRYRILTKITTHNNNASFISFEEVYVVSINIHPSRHLHPSDSANFM